MSKRLSVALDLHQRTAEHIQKILIGRQNCAVEVKLDNRLGWSRAANVMAAALEYAKR